MKKSVLVAALVSISVYAISSPAHAGTIIPYPTPGTENSESYTFTATATGTILAYFFGSNAGDTDSIAVSVNGGPLSAFGLNNQTSSVGSTFDFGGIAVAAGDTLIFVLRDSTTGTVISSNPASNVDGAQHVYSINYTNPGPFAVAGIPTGIFISFEDRLLSQGGDFDYNDDSFVFTNVGLRQIGETPLPAALTLFASGLGLIGFLGWRRKRKT